MERNIRASGWLRSIYIAFGVVFVTVIGGFVEILDLSDHINYGLVKFLEKNPHGLELHGKYLFPKNWFTLFVIVVVLMLLFPAATLLRPLVENVNREKDPDNDTETIGLRQDLDDATRFARNITSYIYPQEEDNRPRFNILSADIKYSIGREGDTSAEAIFKIECVKDPAHFFSFWIRSDPESGDIKFLRQLNLQAFDDESGHKLDWLPTQNHTNTKTLAIFFPEVLPGSTKRLRVTYEWPRFMGKLIELGAANFDWYFLTRDPEKPAIFRQEWKFDGSFAPLDCRIAGRPAISASLRQENHGSAFSWIYEDQSAYLASRCSVEFIGIQSKN